MKMNWTTDLAKCTSRRTCKRNFSQDHVSAVTEQENIVFIHIYLVEPTRGTSNGQIIPAQLLDRWRISFSSTYISSDLQEELQTDIIPAQLLNRRRISSSSISKEWTHRQISKFYESWLWIMFMDLVFFHTHLVGPARGTSHRIMPAQLLNRLSISSSSISQEWTPFYIKCLMLTFIWYAYKFKYCMNMGFHSNL